MMLSASLCSHSTPESRTLKSGGVWLSKLTLTSTGLRANTEELDSNTAKKLKRLTKVAILHVFVYCSLIVITLEIVMNNVF